MAYKERNIIRRSSRSTCVGVDNEIDLWILRVLMLISIYGTTAAAAAIRGIYF